ncbi:MAG TPA: hypothetical protein VME68_07440, partial [Acidobacteriaceae bacterium]|nr:hypothetical protein [Acidobacteriaceae bacterium]
ELASSTAQTLRVPLHRLQCYQGIDEDKAIGQYDRSLQELYVLLMSKSAETPERAQIKREITSRAYFMAGPLLEAIEQDERCVLLIDEIDKVDYAFEAQAFKRACSCFGLGRGEINSKTGILSQFVVPCVCHDSDNLRRFVSFTSLQDWRPASPSSRRAQR